MTSDRQRFLEELDANFSVQAAAGTGKTTALVGRIAALAEKKPEVLGRLVVVTYTHRAADEMRQRVQAELFALRARFSEKNSALLNQGLSRMFLGTIHGFCLRLIREYGLWLGYGAAPTSAAEDDEELFRDFTRQPPGVSAAPAWLAPLHRVVTAREISALAREMSRRTVDWGAVARLPSRTAAEQAALLLSLKVDPEVLADLSAVPARSRETALHWAARWREMAARWNAAAGGFVSVPVYDGGKSKFRDLWREQMAAFADPFLQGAFQAAIQEAAAFQEFRLRSGRLFFGDQIVLAHRLLRQPEVRARLLAEGFHVLLDEAQDTDPLQFELLAELARPAASRLFAWPVSEEAAQAPLPGRFVMVGDGQQAIYRDRASIDIYRRYHDAVGRAPGGACLTFAETFRCRPGVAAFVNDRFQRVLTGEAGQARFVPLRPAMEDEPGQVLRWRRPRLAGGSARKEAMEAAWLAKELRRLGPAGLRARHWGEVAILCPAKNWLAAIHEALRKEGIASVLHFDRPHAEQVAYLWLTALLTLHTEPNNEFEIAGVLRELYGISDEELYRFRYRDGAATPRPLTLHDLPAPRGPIEALLSEWQRCRTRVERLPLAEAVRAWIEQSNLRARLEALGESGAELDRLLLLAHGAQKDGKSLRDFREGLWRGLDQPGAAARVSGEPGIELMTMKKAKGLQWDAVILPFLGHVNRQGGAGDYPKVFFPPGFVRADEGTEPIAVALSASFAASGMAEALEADKDAAELERRRLFYVACTRARHTLVFIDDAPVWEKETEKGTTLPGPNGYGALLGPGEAAEGFSNPLDLSASFLSGTLLPPLVPKETASPLVEADAWPKQVAVGPLRLIRKKTPSRHEEEAAALPQDASLLPRREWIEAAGDEALDYGNWWHETLRRWPWDVEKAASHAAEAARALPEGPWRERGLRELEAFRLSELHGLLASLSPWQRLQEIPYARPLPEEGFVEDGQIDFLYQEADGGWALLDWKTDFWSREGAVSSEEFKAGLKERHASQLRAYREALGGLLPGVEVRRCQVYSTALGAGIWLD